MPRNIDDKIDLGACCACQQPITTGSQTIVMFNLETPYSGTGWGCFQCGLPSNGASAVLCDSCTRGYAKGTVEIKEYIAGRPTEKKRGPIAELTKTFAHNMQFHPEVG